MTAKITNTKKLSTTGAVIKVAYEGQADTNAFDDAAQARLASIGDSLPVATQAEAEAGTSNVVVNSPLRTTQQMAALPDRTHNIQENPYPNITDDFDRTAVGNEWVPAGSHATSTTAISSNQLQITRGGSGTFTTSAQMNRNSHGKNQTVSVDITDNTGEGQIHFRETDASNYVRAYLSTSAASERIKIDKRISGVSTNIAAGDIITNYVATKGYTLTAKTFNNHIRCVLQESDGGIITETDDSDDSDYLALTSEVNGLGVTNATPILYDNYTAQRLTEYTNVVCLGDSNTEGSPTQNAFDAYFSRLIQANFINDGVSSINAGVAGDTINDMQTRVATSVLARRVNDARNICIILGGTNDINGGDSAATAWSDLSTLITTVRDDGWEVWVMTYPPFDNFDADAGITTKNGTKRDFNNLIRNNADTVGFRVVDIETDITDPDDEDRMNTLYRLTENYSHWNAAGQTVIGNKLIALLDLPREDTNHKSAFISSGGIVMQDHIASDIDTDDFLFGSDQLNDDSDTDHDRRFFFEKSTGAWRCGRSTGSEWSTRGNDSFSTNVNNTATGANSFSCNNTNNASGADSLATGRSGAVAGDNGSGFGNDYSAYLDGQMAHASGNFSADGDAQRSNIQVLNETTDGTQTLLTIEGLAVGASTRLVLPASRTWVFEALISARQTGGGTGTVGDSAAYKLTGCIKRDASNNTALVGSVTKVVIAEDAAVTAWDVGAAADDTNENLQILVTGAADKTVHWCADVTLVEVG